MCNNISPEKRKRCDVLGNYAVKVLQHRPLAEIAKEEGITQDELMNALQEIKDINPPLYRQLFE